MKKNRQWLKVLFWIVGSIIFVILTPELRDLVILIMLGIIFSHLINHKLV